MAKKTISKREVPPLRRYEVALLTSTGREIVECHHIRVSFDNSGALECEIIEGYHPTEGYSETRNIRGWAGGQWLDYKELTDE
jgi:hypothetical protein